MIVRTAASRPVRPTGRRLAALLAVLLTALLTGFLSACAGSPGSAQPAADRSADFASYSVLQMNLCLSGLSGCYGGTAYPAVLTEAVDRIREEHPDAVTISEGCSGDVAQVARQTGYHVRFSRVLYFGALLECIEPGGRGLFGDAVLVRSAIRGSENHPFAAQSGMEQRRWLCLTTAGDAQAARANPVTVCTAHLSTRDTHDGPATNDAQCDEVAHLLADRAEAGAVIFGGDLNRRGTCAPDGLWTRTDAAAEQAPGDQHVYGSESTLRSPAALVVPFRHSDHDLLLVRTQPAWSR